MAAGKAQAPAQPPRERAGHSVALNVTARCDRVLFEHQASKRNHAMTDDNRLPISRPDLRSELLELRERDQLMRRTIGERYDNPDAISPADQEWWLRVDSEN